MSDTIHELEKVNHVMLEFNYMVNEDKKIREKTRLRGYELRSRVP